MLTAEGPGVEREGGGDVASAFRSGGSAAVPFVETALIVPGPSCLDDGEARWPCRWVGLPEAVTGFGCECEVGLIGRLYDVLGDE